MKYYDFKTKKTYIEKENNGLKFLYNNIIGRFVLKLITLKPIVNLYALYQDSFLSKHKIKGFIKKNHIDMTEYVDTKYKSFNDFFTRRIKPDKMVIEDGFVSCCDAKLSVYKINNDLTLNIKNSVYTIEELIHDKKPYEDGYALVFRLAVDDYHRYIFPFSGKVLNTKSIKGKLHTVQPIALKKCKVFSENSRTVTEVTSEYGNITIIEVGAMMIGRIINEDVTDFQKGDEKGHFAFGGSTIIYLVPKEIKLANILLDNTKNDIETIVKLGQNLEKEK